MAAVEEEWSSRLNSSLALNQDLEARVAELQKQGSRMRRSGMWDLVSTHLSSRGALRMRRMYEAGAIQRLHWSMGQALC